MGRRDALIEKFRVITGQRLTTLRQGLTALQDAGDAPELAEVGREIHTLKGEAKLLGFTSMSRVALAIEGLLALAEQQGFAATNEATATIVAGFDVLDQLRALAVSDPEGEALARRFGEQAAAVQDGGATLVEGDDSL